MTDPQSDYVTVVPDTAVQAAMDAIERLGRTATRAAVREILEPAAPHIAAAERERLLAERVDEHDRRLTALEEQTR